MDQNTKFRKSSKIKGNQAGKKENRGNIIPFSSIKQNEREIAEKSSRVWAVSGQGQDRVRTGFGQDSVRTVSGQCQGQENISMRLSKRQREILNFLISNGPEGAFSKPQMEMKTKIPYSTIRKALDKFVNTGLLSLEYDSSEKVTHYRINQNMELKNAKKGRAVSGQCQGPI